MKKNVEDFESYELIDELEARGYIVLDEDEAGDSFIHRMIDMASTGKPSTYEVDTVKNAVRKAFEELGLSVTNLNQYLDK